MSQGRGDTRFYTVLATTAASFEYNWLKKEASRKTKANIPHLYSDQDKTLSSFLHNVSKQASSALSAPTQDKNKSKYFSNKESKHILKYKQTNSAVVNGLSRSDPTSAQQTQSVGHVNSRWSSVSSRLINN